MTRDEIIRDLSERSAGAGRGQYMSLRCDVAREIAQDSVDLYAMDKWEMRDYISRSLSNNEKAIEIDRYFINQRRRREIEFGSSRRSSGKAYLSDDFLNADWGLDACDFGIFPWGDS